METVRLYYEDPYLATFTAHVARRGELNGKPAVLLDRTAFYPEGGGQPADHGTLSRVKVTDVQVNNAGEVWHVMEGSVEGDEVKGEVDWVRRFDHMQQHHGQHLLSAAFDNLYAHKTVSFHLGAESATIDLAVKDLSPGRVTSAEDLTNKVIWEDHPILQRFVSAEELASIRLRKVPTVEGAIRVVSAGDFDHSACGGTHPKSTGVVGLVHIRRIEKRGNETRVEFVCGSRALRDLRFANGMMGRMAGALTVGTDELETAMTRLRESEDAARKRVQKLGEELAGFEAETLVNQAKGKGGVPIVKAVYADRTLNDIRYLAAAIAVRGGIALLGAAAEKAQLVFARPAESTVDCGKLLKEVLADFGGKGGGQAAIAQGGIPEPDKLEAVVEAAAARLA